MITPTLWITCQSPAAFDIHGQQVLGNATREKVVPIKLLFVNQHTSVRTDSAGSHGHADEVTSNVIFLALPSTKISIDDILIIVGNTVRVMQTQPRFTVSGKLDHVEIHCISWK